MVIFYNKNMNKLYVKFKKPRNILDFIKLFYSINRNKETLNAQPTYLDKECNNLHCNLYYRSFDDIFTLVKTYYPSTTEKILMNILLKYRVNHGNRILIMHFGICRGTEILRVIPYMSKYMGNSVSKEIPKNSKYSWSILFKLIGIETREKIEEIQKKLINE